MALSQDPCPAWANNETGLPDSKVPATPSFISAVTAAGGLEVIKGHTRWFSSRLCVQNGVAPSRDEELGLFPGCSHQGKWEVV